MLHQHKAVWESTLPQHTRGEDTVLSSPASPARRRCRARRFLVRARGSHLLSSLCCWGQEWQSSFRVVSKAGCCLFFFFLISIISNDTHVAVIHSHVWSLFWEEHSQSSEIKSFNLPLLCLGELFLYPADVGKAGWQLMPRNPGGLLPPIPKPLTPRLHNDQSVFSQDSPISLHQWGCPLGSEKG